MPVNIPSVAVGRFLRGLRIEQNPAMTIGEAAKKVGCNSVHNYTNIENGKRTITPATLFDYVTKLLGDKEEALNRMMVWAMHLHNGDQTGVLRD